MTTNERIARWAGKELAIPDLGGRGAWSPDIDIVLWHGPGGLLEEIERRGCRRQFIEEIAYLVGAMRRPETASDNPPFTRENNIAGVWGAWMILNATPAQLAAAPELYEALEGLLASIECETDSETGAQDVARAALAKARGES